VLHSPLFNGWSRNTEAYRTFQTHTITYTCLSIIVINLLVGLINFQASYESYGLISFTALSVLLINKRGYYHAARWMFIVALYVLTTLVFITGNTPLLGFFLCTAAVVANLVLFSKEEKLELALSFTIPVLLFASVQLLDITLLKGTDASELFSQSSLFVNISFILLSVVLSILYLFSIYEKSERDLRILVAELQVKEQEITRQNEELLLLNANLTASQGELIKNRIFLNSIIDNLPLSLAVKEVKELTYIRVNKASEDLMLYSAVDFINKKDTELYPQTQAKDLLEEDLMVLQSKETIEAERLVTNKNNETKFLYTRKSTICDDKGEPMFILTISEDITPRKQAEEILKRTVKELQTRNHELDNYVYRVSHDLRAPFCSMQGLINLSKTESNIDNIKQYIDLIEKSVHKSDRFIQSILNHSKVLNTELQIEAIDLPTLANSCFQEALHYIAGADQIKMEVRTEVSSPFGSDLFRVNIILHNLLANAVRYSKSNAADHFVNIDIHASQERAVISIADNGEGIMEEHLPKIFDMFFRGSEKATGSGLGLYIAHQAIEALGGTIQVESKPNQGATFIVTLPNLINKTAQLYFL
jgi:PAS domain S-box-containing protein